MSKVQSGKKFKLVEEDYKALFVPETFTIGTTVLTFEAQSIGGFSRLLGRVGEIMDTTKGIDFSPLMNTMNSGVMSLRSTGTGKSMVPFIAKILGEHVPELLEMLTGLDREDAKKIPVSIAMELLAKAIDLNLKGHEDFAKNFETLTESVVSLMGNEIVEEVEVTAGSTDEAPLPPSSKPLSATGTTTTT